MQHGLNAGISSFAHPQPGRDLGAVSGAALVLATASRPNSGITPGSHRSLTFPRHDAFRVDETSHSGPVFGNSLLFPPGIGMPWRTAATESHFTPDILVNDRVTRHGFQVRCVGFVQGFRGSRRHCRGLEKKSNRSDVQTVIAAAIWNSSSFRLTRPPLCCSSGDWKSITEQHFVRRQQSADQY